MIVITGASSGIGLELAKLYQEEGKKVINISRHESEFADVNVLKNLCEGKEIKAAAQAVKELDETLETIINCVGVYTEQEFGKITEDEIKRLMSSNVKAPMLLISELIERVKKDSTDILNVVSKAGTHGSANNPVYATSKWAERGFTLSLQAALKDTPSRVTSFCPGGIRTDLFEKAGANIDIDNWMDPVAVALFIKQILELPKNMEVSEVLINRKSVK
jgi:short-subunit dehydrogenase